MKLADIIKNIQIPFYSDFNKNIKKPFYLTLRNKTFFKVFNILISLYINYVFYLAYSPLFTSKWADIGVICVALCFLIITYNFIVYLSYKLRNCNLSIYESKKKLNKKTLLVYSVPCLLILILSLCANFPGLKSPDIIKQWQQVESFAFNDWHPPMHTFIIWLVTRINERYVFFMFFQILLFSVGVGYLIATLESWGFRKKVLIITYCVIILNPYTINIMMYAWKDCFLTILLVYASSMLVDIYLSEGKWLLKVKNIIFFSIVVGLASLVRHNGIFFTIPLLLLLLINYRKNGVKIYITVLSVVLVIFLIKVPLYSALKVKHIPNTYSESVGIPMNILNEILLKKPDALSPETKDMLYKMAPEEKWRARYRPGDFNNIKFASNFQEEIKNVPPKDFFKMVFDAIGSARREAFIAFRNVTQIVWSVSGDISIVRPRAYEPIEKNIEKILCLGFNLYTDFIVRFPVLSSILTKTGCSILALLIVGIISFNRKGFKLFLLILPSLAYNFGTMLLLCTADDIRFFHFNVVITLPLILLLLSDRNKLKEKQPE